MNRAINSAAAEKRRVRRVHDRVNLEFRDITLHDLNLVLRLFLHERFRISHAPKRCGDASQSKSTSCENQSTRLFYFAPAFGVRTRPRVAFLPGTAFSETIPSTTKHFSRRQPLDQPTSIRLSRVSKPVIQTVWTALPEFDPIRFEPITAPVRRQWNRLVAEAFGRLCHARVEHAPAVDYLALTRRPCAQLAADRTRMKISLLFFPRGF